MGVNARGGGGMVKISWRRVPNFLSALVGRLGRTSSTWPRRPVSAVRRERRREVEAQYGTEQGIAQCWEMREAKGICLRGPVFPLVPFYLFAQAGPACW